MVNNIRDLDTDRRAGKRTLAVRLGRARALGVFDATLYAASPGRAVVAIAAGQAVAA